jgi:hypothetical protein
MPRCSAAGLGFIIIPAGFNPLRQRLRGECAAGISNGVYSSLDTQMNGSALFPFGKENFNSHIL